jgi:hypothetical protein
MAATFAIPFTWVIVVVQVLGLLSAGLARFSEGSRGQVACQWLFFACLILVGLTTMAALGFGPGHWILLGATFSTMVLSVTCDFSHPE